jgi:transporter family protein
VSAQLFGWLPLALLTALAFALYNVFIKLGAGRIHEVLGAVVLQVAAVVLGGGFALYLHLTGQRLAFSKGGLLFAVLAGLAVGLAEILTFVVFARGAPVSLGTPVILGGSILAAALIGALLLREQLGVAQVLGVVLIVAGVALITRTGH